ncbi:MAG: flotillin domain-containing protein [Candidatus Limnocylindria bacterium]
MTRRQTELAELAAARTEKELLASTVRPAEADAEAVVRRAEGDRQAKIAAAQAEAERQKLAGQAEASVLQVKGEAQARVVTVNAEAEAHRTEVEGNAEAGVTLTKGEAEAKALALRAEAYKQFNEAAVIQTVLGMLPEIVRAAAEPMGKIGSLTVLSSDGASEVVRTTTRTVAEAGAAVKGLTGLDVPALIGEAMGARADGGPPAPPSEPPTRETRRRQPAASQPSAPTRADRPQASRTQAEPATAFADAVDTIRRAGATGPTAGPLRAQAAEPTLEIDEATPPDDAAAMLAEALGRVPGINRYRGATLAELANRGPRIARGLWGIARPRLTDRYGAMTIGQLLERFASTRSNG